MAHISQHLDNRVEHTRAETMICLTPHPGNHEVEILSGILSIMLYLVYFLCKVLK